MSTAVPRAYYWQALRTRAVWARAARLGLVVGILQASLNQGDHWLHHRVDGLVVFKTIISPLLSFGIALASATATHAENLSRTHAPSTT